MMGRMPRCVEVILSLLSNEDNEVVANAATCIANMGFNNSYNQELIGKFGGIEKLVKLVASPAVKSLSLEPQNYAAQETEVSVVRSDVDILDAATAALANLCSRNEMNSTLLSKAGGLYALVDLCHSYRGFDVTDRYRLEDIEANAAEAVANATKYENEATISVVMEKGTKPFVLMLASKNKTVLLNAALVLGNLAQNDKIRVEIGEHVRLRN